MYFSFHALGGVIYYKKSHTSVYMCLPVQPFSQADRAYSSLTKQLEAIINWNVYSSCSIPSVRGEVFAIHISDLQSHKISNRQAINYFNMNVLIFAEPGNVQFFRNSNF